MKSIFLILFLLSFDAAAYQSSIIVPVFTAHTNDTGFNNKNHGLGLEIKTNKASYSITAIDKNSHNESSVYLSVSRIKAIKRGVYLSAGIIAASGYKDSKGSNVIIFPVVSAQFYNLRISTTYPSAQLLCDNRGQNTVKHSGGVDSYDIPCSDIINIQYIQEF